MKKPVNDDVTIHCVHVVWVYVDGVSCIDVLKIWGAPRSISQISLLDF